jgi:hypothetical protein
MMDDRGQASERASTWFGHDALFRRSMRCRPAANQALWPNSCGPAALAVMTLVRRSGVIQCPA